jgi:predicted secreted protein
MATLRGSNVLVSIEGTILALQKDCSLNIQADSFEIMWKGSDSWKSSETTYKSWSVDCECVYVFPDVADTNGFDALWTAFESSTPVEVLIAYDSTTQATLVSDDQIGFEGEAYIENYNLTFPNEGERSLSFTLKGNGALTRVDKA